MNGYQHNFKGIFYNLILHNVSAPYKPENIVAIPIYISKNVYHINITWNLPPIKPYYYIVNVSDYDNYTESVNISGVS